MNIWKVIVLAIVQGLTEFLPISSSGHLVLTERILGVFKDDITFEIALHLGTLIAIIIVFRTKLLLLLKSFYKIRKFKEIEEVRLFAFIILGTIPAVCVGLFAKESIEQVFGMPQLTCLMLFITGIFLLLTKFSPRVPARPMNWFSSLIIGISQALAILPGISRSGWTIGTARLFGIKPEKAYSFSFLLAIPAILGATILQVFKLERGFFKFSNFYVYVIGIITSAIVGYFALIILKKIVMKEKFYIFGLYCIFISILFIIIL